MEKPAKILVIDDDPDIGNMFKMILGYKGYTTIVLENTGQATAIVRNEDIDVVIMDMNWSGTNGSGICVEFKKRYFNFIYSAHYDVGTPRCKKDLHGGRSR